MSWKSCGSRRSGVLSILGLLALAACAVSDEGASDFRTVRASDAQPGTGADAWHKLVQATAITDQILENENVQVTLKTAFINDFWALFGHPAVSRGAPNGEIAIVASAYEDDGSVRPRFATDAIDNAKVIFFSDDVVQGQFLNIGPGLPIYGPTEYRGFPLRIDIWVIELDQPGDQLRRLLDVLALMGSTSVPATAAIAQPLAKLASTLITDRQDDPAFHYTFTLEPAGGTSASHVVALETGDIVIVREKYRRNQTDWGAMALNRHVGRLMHHPAPSGECLANATPALGCEYRDKTYLVLEVGSAKKPLQNGRVDFAMAHLRQQYAGESAPILTATGFENAKAAAGEIVAHLASRDRADGLGEPLRELRGKNGCAGGQPNAARRRAAESFVAGWFTNGDDVPKLAGRDRDRLLERAGLVLARESDQAKVNGRMQLLRAGNAATADQKNDLTAALAGCVA